MGATSPAPRASAASARDDRPRTEAWTVSDDAARRHFRVLTRVRSGYNGSTMYDVQLQASSTGTLVWAQTFTDRQQADEYERRLDADLDDLADADFRRKYNVTSEY